MNTFLPEIVYPYSHDEKVIIAMKGLPSTGKSEIAMLIGEWARANVLYIDDFLETLSLEKVYTAEAMPCTEEADRVLCIALDGLYKAAARHLRESNRVVIKSRLCSTFELDLLIRLIRQADDGNYFKSTTIIVESQMKNEYRWRSKLDRNRERSGEKWYKARSWEDIQKAKEDDNENDSQALDFHLLSSLKVGAGNRVYNPRARRLVLDFFDDAFSLDSTISLRTLSSDFKDAIIYLLITNHENKGTLYKAHYFNELSRYLLEEEIRTSKERRKYLCSISNSRAGSCVFKFWEELPAGSICYKACEEGVASGNPGYRCHFCFLTLHKSCAEIMPNFNFLNDVRAKSYDNVLLSPQRGYSCSWEMLLCKSCNELGKRFYAMECETCYYENNLKSGLLPTIINHNCHDLHFLSIHFEVQKCFRCKACAGSDCYNTVNYVCHLCKFVYHLDCVFLPREVKQEHGGHEHVMKLMYSHHGIELEDDHWCNACYQDMDPQNWFYSCRDCPYYVTHAATDCAGRDGIYKAIRNGNLPLRRTDNQQQIQAKCEDEDHDKVLIASNVGLAAAIDHARAVDSKGSGLDLNYPHSSGQRRAQRFGETEASGAGSGAVATAAMMVAGLGVAALYAKRRS